MKEYKKYWGFTANDVRLFDDDDPLLKEKLSSNNEIKLFVSQLEYKLLSKQKSKKEFVLKILENKYGDSPYS